MGIGVNGLSADSLTDKVYSKYSNTSVNTNMSEDESTSYLDFDGYLELLTAQMSNQDFNNSMSDSEFIQQMSSYSMMEAIKQLTNQSAITYTSSLIGKAVTVSDGSSNPDTGIVEAVTVTSDGCNILVNGNQYPSSSITDVIDGDVYHKLNSFTGQTVSIKDGDETVTGKVTGVCIKNGNGFVTIDNKATYPLNAITEVIKPEEDKEETEDSAQTEDSEAQTVQVEESTASVAYSARGEQSGVVTASDEAFDKLMKILDGESDVSSTVNDYAGSALRARLQSRVQTAAVNDIMASSGISSDRVPAPMSINGLTTNAPVLEAQDFNNGSSVDGIDSVPLSVYNQKNYTNSNAYSAASNSSYDNGDNQGVVSVSQNPAQAQNIGTYSDSLRYNSASYIPSSTRVFAEEYPLEAAFADSTGTHMGDIRFIGNTDIMNRIDTSEIIAYTEKGYAVTDIGWCGLGRLGEVITYTDGRQRVEVIGNKGISYLYTTGNYTLSEMFNKDVPPGYFVGKLSPQEIAIAHYAEEYTPEEQAEMDAFGEYCANHARINGLGF